MQRARHSPQQTISQLVLQSTPQPLIPQSQRRIKMVPSRCMQSSQVQSLERTARSLQLSQMQSSHSSQWMSMVKSQERHGEELRRNLSMTTTWSSTQRQRTNGSSRPLHSKTTVQARQPLRLQAFQQESEGQRKLILVMS